MDIRLLRAFITVAEQGSYRQAADVLHLTQPALSKRIQALEQLIGGALFLRGRHGATLTELGHQLYPEANDLVKQHQRFLRYAQSLQKQSCDILRIGFGISSFNNVPGWINRFQSRYPHLKISVRHIPSSEQFKLLMNGDLHVGFTRLPASESMSAIMIKKERLMLAAPSDINPQPKSVQDILRSMAILQMHPTQSPCLADQTQQYLQERGIGKEAASVADDIHTLLALVAGGNGVALLPESVGHFLPAGVELRSAESHHAGWDIGAVWNPQQRHPQRDEFIAMVKETVTP